MKLFLDTAECDEIRSMVEFGCVDGVTTNPSLIARSGRPIFSTISEICEMVTGPVSAEVVASDADGMISQGLKIGQLASNAVVKLPLTWPGLQACSILTFTHNLNVNMTLCFTSNQALLAGRAGAKFISPFVGRFDDIGGDGISLLEEIRNVYDQDPEITTEILAASLRHVYHVSQAAQVGANAATMPPKVMKDMLSHPMTDKGLAAFMADWEKRGEWK